MLTKTPNGIINYCTIQYNTNVQQGHLIPFPTDFVAKTVLEIRYKDDILPQTVRFLTKIPSERKQIIENVFDAKKRYPSMAFLQIKFSFSCTLFV